MSLGTQVAVTTFTFLVLAQSGAGQQATGARDLEVTVGKSVVVESPVNIQRVSVANGAVAEAVAVTPREVLINGLAPGETSVIVWQENASRLFFDLTVRPGVDPRLDVVRKEMAREIGSDAVTFEIQGENVFLRGTVPDLTLADRAVAIASTLGKPVNLLRVNVPPADTQILLKVKFLNVDRAVTRELGANFFSTGAAGTPGSISTQQFEPPTLESLSSAPGETRTNFDITNLLNIFFFRPDLNLGATFRLLQSKRLLEILAEPNVVALNGRPASFLAGGEFPFPTLQGGGGGLGAVTIQFREFGVRINVTPVITPRGTMRLMVTPEVSSLDFANGLLFQGFNIPALATRRVQTELEVEDGQSFAIGGLLDNRVTENLSKVPGLGDIPFFGKLFRSQQLIKNNSELLIVVTPEIVRPIPKGQPTPELKFPMSFMEPNTAATAPRTPGIEVTGPVPLSKPTAPIPVEELQQALAPPQQQQAQTPIQFVPAQLISAPALPTTPQAQPAPAAPASPKPPAPAPGK